MKLVTTEHQLKKIIVKNIECFALEHVKEFNKNWNYFSGMNDDQVIEFLKIRYDLAQTHSKL